MQFTCIGVFMKEIQNVTVSNDFYIFVKEYVIFMWDFRNRNIQN